MCNSKKQNLFAMNIPERTTLDHKEGRFAFSNASDSLSRVSKSMKKALKEHKLWSKSERGPIPIYCTDNNLKSSFAL